MGCRPQSIYGAMMDNRLQPAIDTAVMFLVRGRLAPYRQKYFLHNIFGGCAFLKDAISQGISIAMVSCVESLDCPFGTLANGRDEFLVGEIFLRGKRLLLNLGRCFYQLDRRCIAYRG